MMNCVSNKTSINSWTIWDKPNMIMDVTYRLWMKCSRELLEVPSTWMNVTQIATP